MSRRKTLGIKQEIIESWSYMKGKKSKHFKPGNIRRFHGGGGLDYGEPGEGKYKSSDGTGTSDHDHPHYVFCGEGGGNPPGCINRSDTYQDTNGQLRLRESIGLVDDGSHPELYSDWEWFRGRRKYKRGTRRRSQGPQPHKKRRGGRF